MAIRRSFKVCSVIIYIKSVIHTTRGVQSVYFTWVAQNSHHLKGYVHTISHSFWCRHEKLSGKVRTASAQNLNESFTHIEHRAGAIGREGSNIYFHLSGFQSSLILSQFCCGQRNNCSHWIKVRHRNYPICDASFSGSAQHSFAPLQESHRV